MYQTSLGAVTSKDVDVKTSPIGEVMCLDVVASQEETLSWRQACRQTGKHAINQPRKRHVVNKLYKCTCRVLIRVVHHSYFPFQNQIFER